jgi:hypothetical protein
MIKKVIICDRCKELNDIEKRISALNFMIAEQQRKGYITSLGFLQEGYITMAKKRSGLMPLPCSCKIVYQEKF